MLTERETRRWAIGLALVFALSAYLQTACAAKGPRNTTRVAALTAGDLALDLDKTERDIRAANLAGYDKPKQDAVGAGILKVLYATRAFERAARQWHEGDNTPAAVDSAKAAVVTALNDLQNVLPAIDGVRIPLLKALNALKAFLSQPTAYLADVPPIHAELPLPPAVLSIFALAQLAAQLVASGRTTFGKLKAALQKEGATDEELDALDVKLTDAIAQREAERGAGG